MNCKFPRWTIGVNRGDHVKISLRITVISYFPPTEELHRPLYQVSLLGDRGTGVNNLTKVVMQFCPSGNWTHDLVITRPMPNRPPWIGGVSSSHRADSDYTAWWQRHIFVNNLTKVVMQLCPGCNWTHDLLIASPTPYHYTTTPPVV